MTWQIYAILSVLFLSVANVLQRALMKEEKSDALSSSIFFQFACTIIVGIFALFKGFHLPPISETPINYLVMGVLYGIGTYFLLKATQYLESSEVTIITASRALITILSAILFLGESFNQQKIVGTVLILSAVVLISFKKGIFIFNKGVWYAFGMAVCYGLAVTNDAYLLRSTDVISYLVIGFLFPGLFLLALKPTVITSMRFLLKPPTFKKIMFLSLTYTLSAIYFFSSLDAGGQASQVSPINQSAVILTVILAAIFLGERGSLVKKLISAVICFIGILLIT